MAQDPEDRIDREERGRLEDEPIRRTPQQDEEDFEDVEDPEEKSDDRMIEEP